MCEGGVCVERSVHVCEGRCVWRGVCMCVRGGVCGEECACV